MDVQLFTMEDCLDACELFIRNSEKSSLDQASQRMCVESGLREIVSAHEWQSMRKQIRIHLQATQNTGSIAYCGQAGTAYSFSDGTAGTTTVDREVVLHGATWPSWVLDGELRLGTYSLNCIVDNVIDSTHAQLDPQFYPSVDYASGQGFMLGLPKYPLPPEFAAGIVAAERNAWFIGTYVPPDQWFLMDKYRVFSGIVRNFTIMPDPKRYGQQALYVHPCPSIATEYDLQIKAWRRPMRLSGKEPWNYQGTVTITTGSTAVVGSGTAFDQRMVGAVLRVTGAGAQKPTGTAGKNPYLFQQTIASVTDATHLTLSNAAPSFPSGSSAQSSIGYSVSDPCDVPAALWDCFKAACYAQLAQFCAPKEYLAVRARYETMLRTAKAADNFNRTTMGVGTGVQTISRLRDNPNRPTIGR